MKPSRRRSVFENTSIRVEFISREFATWELFLYCLNEFVWVVGCILLQGCKNVGEIFFQIFSFFISNFWFYVTNSHIRKTLIMLTYPVGVNKTSLLVTLSFILISLNIHPTLFLILFTSSNYTIPSAIVASQNGCFNNKIAVSMRLWIFTIQQINFLYLFLTF